MISFRQREFRDRGDKHQHHGQQDGEERQPEAGQPQSRVRPVGRGHGRRVGLDVFHRPLRVERTRDHGRGNAHDETPEQHEAHVGLERIDGHNGAGMGRHHTMHDRETGEQRQGQEQERLLRLAGEREQNRQQEHQADGEPRRQPHGQGQRHDAPLDVFRTEEGGESFRQHFRAARFREQLPEHGAQAEHRRDAAERRTEAILDGFRDAEHGVGNQFTAGILDLLIHQHRAATHDERGDDERDEGVQLEARDEQHEHADGREGQHDEFPVVGIHLMRGRFP